MIQAKQTKKRYKGLCAFQENCIYTSEQCRFIHVLNETTMRKVIREAIEELVCTSKIVCFEDTYDSNKNDAKDSTITENEGTPELSITTNTEEMRCIHEKTKQSQKAQNNRKIARPPKSNTDSESSTPFGLKRKAAGRQVMSSNSGCSENKILEPRVVCLNQKWNQNFL